MKAAELIQLVGTYEAPRAVQIAIKMGLFEALASGARTSAHVARQIRASRRGTLLLLNAMVALNLLKKVKTRYALTAAAKKYLIKTSPQSYATMIEFIAGNYLGFGELEKAVRSGRSIIKKDMFQDDRKRLEAFIGAMHDLTVVRGDGKILARQLNFKKYARLLDIGGGPGTYSIAFCQANPQLRATVYDLPATCRIARRMLRKNDKTKRVSVLEGDYNKGPLPKGYDVAFLSNIVHSETERENQRLAKRCYAALNPGGQMIIKDHVLTDDLCRPKEGALFSLTMLLYTRGRSYAEKEMKQWLKDAGFKKVRRVRTPKPMTSDLIIGEKL